MNCMYIVIDIRQTKELHVNDKNIHLAQLKFLCSFLENVVVDALQANNYMSCHP